MTACALVLPLCFVGPQDWRVTQWIWAHRLDFVVYGLRWVALSLLFAVVFSIWMTIFGHQRDHEVEIDEEARHWDEQNRKDGGGDE